MRAPHLSSRLLVLGCVLTAIGCSNQRLQPNAHPIIAQSITSHSPAYATFIAQSRAGSEPEGEPAAQQPVEPQPFAAEFNTMYTADTLPDWAVPTAGFDVEHYAFTPVPPEYLYHIAPPSRSYYGLDEDDCDTSPEYDAAFQEYSRLMKIRRDLESIANKHRRQIGQAPYRRQHEPRTNLDNVINRFQGNFIRDLLVPDIEFTID